MPNYREYRELADAVVREDASDMIAWLLEHMSGEIEVCRCERCESLVHSEDTRWIDDCQSWCESCTECAAYYWESDDEYHSEPEPHDDEDSYSGYHSSTRARAQRGQIGVEVELKFHDEPREVNEAANDAGLYVEEDASLGESNSAEVITDPFTPDRKGLKTLGGLTEFLDAVRASGWSKSGYGIHVNIDRRGLSRYDLARVERFLFRNPDDVFRVAGRANCHWSQIQNRRTRELGLRTEKYSALRIADDRIEFRLFQSNAKADGVRHCVRFSLDLIDYCRRSGWSRLDWSSFCEAYPFWRTFRTSDDAARSV
jgi:hypothetical protein